MSEFEYRSTQKTKSRSRSNGQWPRRARSIFWEKVKRKKSFFRYNASADVNSDFEVKGGTRGPTGDVVAFASREYVQSFRLAGEEEEVTVIFGLHLKSWAGRSDQNADLSGSIFGGYYGKAWNKFSVRAQVVELGAENKVVDYVDLSLRNESSNDFDEDVEEIELVPGRDYRLDIEWSLEAGAGVKLGQNDMNLPAERDAYGRSYLGTQFAVQLTFEGD